MRRYMRDLGLHIVDIALCAPKERSHRPSDTTQPLRPEYDQRDDAVQRHPG